MQLVALATRGTGMRAVPVRVAVPLFQHLGGLEMDLMEDATTLVAGCCTAGVRSRAPTIHARARRPTSLRPGHL